MWGNRDGAADGGSGRVPALPFGASNRSQLSLQRLNMRHKQTAI
jgi:hypothetical protein